MKRTLKIISGSIGGVAVAAVVAGSIAGCLVHKHNDEKNKSQDLYKNSGLIGPIYNYKNSFSASGYSFAQFVSLPKTSTSNGVSQTSVIKGIIYSSLIGKTLNNGELVNSEILGEIVIQSITINEQTKTVSFQLGWSSSNSTTPVTYPDSFTLNGFSTSGANTISINPLPQFSGLTNEWSNAVSTTNNQPKPVKQIVLNQNDPYYTYKQGTKIYYPISSTSALQIPSIRSTFVNWISSETFNQDFQNNITNYVVNTISSAYQNWHQGNILVVKNGVLFGWSNQNQTKMSVSTSDATATVENTGTISIQVTNTGKQSELLTIFGQNCTVPGGQSLGLTIDLNGAIIAPTLVSTSTSDVMNLSYNISNFKVSSFTSSSKTNDTVTVSNPVIITSNPPSLNAIVENVSTQIGDTNLFPVAQKAYLNSLKINQIEDTIVTYAQNNYNKITIIGSNLAKILTALINGSSLGSFLESIGQYLAPILTSFGLPQAYATVTQNFLSTQTFSQFVENPENEAAIEAIIGSFTNSPLVMNGFESLWGSLSNTFNDGKSSPAQVTTITPYNPSVSVIENLENLLESLPKYGNTPMVQIIGDNFNFLISVLENGMNELKLPTQEQTKIQTILDGITEIVNKIQPNTINPITSTKDSDDQPTANIMNINYMQTLETVSTLEAVVNLVQTTLGPILPPNVQNILKVLQRIPEEDPNINNITPDQLKAFYESFLTFTVLSGPDTGKQVPISELFTNQYLTYTQYSGAGYTNGFLGTPTYQNGILNSQYAYNISLVQKIQFNLEPLKTILNYVSVGQALEIAGVNNSTEDGIATLLGGNVGDHLPSEMIFSAGEGVVNTITFDDTQLGVQYNSNANAISWTAPMQSNIYPNFWQTANEFISYIEDGFDQMLNGIINSHLTIPLYFYLHYKYTNNYLFNSLDATPVGQDVAQNKNLNNDWNVPSSEKYNPDVVTYKNSFQLSKNYLDIIQGVDSQGTLTSSGASSRTVASEIISILNQNVDTNPNPSSYESPSSNLLSYNFEVANIDDSNVQGELWNLVKELGIVGSNLSQPEILANITPSFELSGNVSQGDASLRQFSISLYFKNPIILTGILGTSQITNWVNISLSSSTNNQQNSGTNSGKTVINPNSILATSNIYDYTIDGNDAIITGLNRKNYQTYESEISEKQKPTITTMIPSAVIISGKSYNVTQIGISEQTNLFAGLNINWNVVIPSSITYIAPYAFSKATFNGTVTIENNPNLQSSSQTGGKSHPFAGATFNGNVIFGQGWTEIPDSFFNSNSSSSISYPSTIFNAGLIIPNTVTIIGQYAFNNAVFKQQFNLPPQLTEIGQYAFHNCSFGGTFTMPNTVTTIGNCAFASSTFTGTLTLSSGIKTIGSYGFSGCDFMGEVVLPDGLTSLVTDETYDGSGYIFNDSTFHESLVLPKTLTNIGWWAFNEATIDGNLTISATSLNCDQEGWPTYHNGFDTLTVKGNLYVQNQTVANLLFDATIDGQTIIQSNN